MAGHDSRINSEVGDIVRKVFANGNMITRTVRRVDPDGVVGFIDSRGQHMSGECSLAAWRQWARYAEAVRK